MQHAREAGAALYNGFGEPPVTGDDEGGDRLSPSPDRPLPVSPGSLAETCAVEPARRPDVDAGFKYPEAHCIPIIFRQTELKCLRREY